MNANSCAWSHPGREGLRPVTSVPGPSEQALNSTASTIPGPFACQIVDAARKAGATRELSREAARLLRMGRSVVCS